MHQIFYSKYFKGINGTSNKTAYTDIKTHSAFQIIISRKRKKENILSD